MGDAQSVFEEGEPGQDAAERQVEDDKKLLKNNCQIDAKSATLLVEVNGIQEDDTNAQDDWLPENPPKEVETKVVGNEMEPIKEGKKKGVSSEVTEVEAKHNDINESFKTFFSKVGLKFTLKRGSRDHGENQEGDSTEVQKPTEQIQDDTTQADTTCESKNEDSTWPTEGEATDSQNEVNIPDEEWTHLDTPSEQDPSSPSSPKEHVTMSPMKKFFALGLFTRLGKKRLSLEDETITRELVMEEVGDTEKEMAQDQNEDIENTTVALADVYKEENPPADMISEPGGPNEIEDVPSSALKRLLLGSSLVKIKRQKEAKTSVGEQCQPSSDDPDQLLSPAAMAENDKKQSPTQPAETTVVQEEESPWATFKKLLSPKKRVNRSALNNDDMQNPMPKDELKSSEGDDILECRMDEGKKRKDSAISWDAILCARSQTATDFDDETQTDDANGTEAVENYDNCDVLASTPKKAASPPESDVESLCQAFKRLMSPKRKAKLVEEMQRSPETESMQENVSLLGKIFPGWNKRKSVPNKDQEATSCEVDQVGDLNCIMPLYDYDIVETEPKETVAGREPSTKTDIDLKQDFLPEVMDAAPPSENLQTEEPLQIVEGLQNEAANEDLAHLTEFIEKALSDIPEEGELTESTTAENVIVITSEVRSAPHPVEVSLADNSAMISALSQQAEKTSDATIPVLTKAQVEETEELMQPGVESTTTLPEADLLCSDTIVGSVLCDTLGEDSHLPGSKQSNAPTTMIDLVPNEMEAATDETESSIADKIISTEALDTQEITPTEKLDMKKISTPIPTEEIDTEEITLHISTKELETVGITHAIPNEEPDIEKITPQILVEKLDIKEIKSPIRSKELDTQSTTTPSTKELHTKEITSPIPTQVVDTKERGPQNLTKELGTTEITSPIPTEELDIETTEITSPIPTEKVDTEDMGSQSLTKELSTTEITSPIPTKKVDTEEMEPQILTKELGTIEITSPIPTEKLDTETTEITSPIPTEKVDSEDGGPQILIKELDTTDITRAILTEKLDTETIEITSPIPTEKVNTEEMAPQILTKLGTMEITRPIPTEVVDTEKTGPQVLPKDFHTTEVKTPIPTEKLDTETTVKVDTEDMEPQILTKELGTIDITNTILTQVVDTKERGPQILTKGPDTTEITSPISTEKVDTEDMGPQILTKELDTTESTSSIPTDVFDTGEMGPQVLTKESDTTEITSSIPTEEVDTEEMGPQVLTKELNTTEITSPIPTELVDTEEMEPQVLTKELNTTIGTIDITSPILTEKLDTETTEITSPIPTEKVDTEDMGPQSLTKVLGTTEITSPIPTKKLDTETIEITSPIPTEKVNTEEMEPQILTKDLNTTEITSPIRTEVVDTEKMGPQVLPKDFHTTEVKTPIPTEKLDTETTVKVDTEDMEPQILTKELGTIDITSPILTQVVDTKERGPQILTKGPDTTESTSSIPTEKVDTEDMGPQILTKELDTTESTSSIPTDVFDTGEMGPQVLTKEPDTTEITSSIPTEEVDTEEMGPQVLTKELNTTEITSPIPTELVDTEEMEPQVLTKELNTTIGTIDITSPILTEKLDTETTEITSPIPTEKVDTEDMGPQSLTKVLGTTEITSPIPTKKGDTEEMEPQILTKELGTMAITSPIPTEKLDTETTELTSPIPTEKVDAEDSGPQILPKELDKTDITRAIPTEKLDTETTEITRHIPTEVVDTEETEPQILTKELGTTEITSPIPTEVVDTEETGPQILTKELSTTVITSPIPTEKLDTEETGPQILTKELSTTVITSPIPTEKLDTETTEITSTIPTEEVDTQEMAPQILTKEHDTIDITSPIPTDKLDTEEIRRQILINELHTTEITSPIPTEKLDTPSLTEGLSTKESKPFIQTEVLYTKTETTPPIPTKELQTVEITPPILTEELDSKEIKTPIFIEELDIEEFTPTCTEEPGTEEIIHSIPNKELNIEEIKPVIPTEGLDMEEIIPPMTTWKIRTPIQTEELNTEEITPSVLAKELDTQENTPPIPKEEFNTTEITIPILAKELEPQETSPPIPTEELDTNEIKTQFPIEELDIEETKPARTEEPDTEDMKPSIATKKPDIEELKSPFHTEELDTQEITPPIPTEDLDIKEISTPNPDKGLDTKEIRLPTPTKAYEIEDITPALPTETLNTKEIKPNHSEDLHSKEITTPIPSQELGTEDIRAPPSTEEHGTDDITPPIPAKGFKIEEIQTPFLTEVLGTNKISTPTPQILIQEPPTKELTLPSPTQETNIEEIVPPIHTENSATEAITASIPTRKLDSSEITHPILSQEVDTQENSARIFYEQFDGEEIIPPIPTDEFDAVEIKHPITAQELDTEVILPPNSTQKFDYKETPPHISTKELETEEMATEKTKTAHFSNSENNFSKLDSMDEIHVFLEDCLCDISKGESSEQLMEHEAVATEDDIEAPRSEKTAHTDLKESDTKQNTLQMVIIHQKVKVTSEKCPEAFTEELQSTKEISSEPILNSGEVSGAQTETLALQECRLQLALDKVLCEKVASEVKETTKLLSEISTEPFNKDVAKEPVDTSQDELIRETEAVQATPQQSEKVEAELVENQKEESILLPEVEEKAMAAPEIEIIQEQVSVATQKKQLEPDLVEVQHAEVKEDIHGEDPLMEEVKDENVPLLEADIKPEENDQRRASDIQIELVKEDKDTVVLDLSVKAEGISESILAEEAMTDEVKYSPLPGSENELESKDQKAKAEFSSLKEVVQESCLKSYEHQEVGDPQKTMTEECEQEKASQLQTIIESAKDEVDVDANEIEPVEETLGQSKQSIQTESVEAEETIFAEEMMTAELKEETVCSTEVQPPSDQQAAAVVKTGLNPDQAVAQEGEAITDIAEDKTGEVKEEAISLSETNVEANQEADTRKEMELLEKPSQALSVNVTNEVPEEANQEADTQKEVVLLEKHAQVISLSETNVVPEEANQEAENEMENIHFFEALVSKEANMELLQSEETTEVILVEESLPSEHKDQVEPLPELPGNKDMKQISDLTEGTPAKKTEDTQNESMKSGAETEVLQSVSDEVQEPQEVTAVKTEIIEEVPMSGLGTNEESLTQTFSKETLVEEISETENDIASEAEETKPQRDQAFNKEEDSENTDLHRQQDVMDREEDGTPEVSEAPVSLHQKEQSCAQILEKVIYEEIPEVCGTLEDQVKLQAHQSDVENKTEGENHDLPEVTTAEVAHALVTQVTMCHFKKVSTSLPDLITTSSDMQEPLLEYVLPESTEMVVSELPTITKNNLAQRARVANEVVMMQATAMEVNHSIQVQVVQMDITTAEKSVDQILEVGIGDKGVTDVCNRNIEGLEEVMQENYAGMCHELVPHVMENKLETLDQMVLKEAKEVEMGEVEGNMELSDETQSLKVLVPICALEAEEPMAPTDKAGKAPVAKEEHLKDSQKDPEPVKGHRTLVLQDCVQQMEPAEKGKHKTEQVQSPESFPQTDLDEYQDIKSNEVEELQSEIDTEEHSSLPDLKRTEQSEVSVQTILALDSVLSVDNHKQLGITGENVQVQEIEKPSCPKAPSEIEETALADEHIQSPIESTETQKQMELVEKHVQTSENPEPLPPKESTETQEQKELLKIHDQGRENQDPLPQNDSPETQEQTKLQEKYFQASGTQEPISQRESTETQKQMNLQQKDVQASQIQELIAQEESTETQKHKEISEEHEQAIDNQVASPQEEPTESQTEQVQASENQKPLPQKEFMETQKQTEETEEFVQATETEMVSFPKEPATDQNQAVRIEETSEPASELKSTEITAKANSSVLSGLPTREIEDPVEEKLPMITVKLILEIQPVETMEPQEAVGATVDETPNMWKTQTFKCASKPETEDDGEEIWMDAKEEIEIQEAPKDESPRRDGNFEAERECEGGHFDIAVDNSKMESAPVAERDRAGRAEEQKVTTAEKDALN
ncbi:titin isoform X16 [Syngnathus acus]|uniref:titin isoform X16 n=1 Tax=Syngnathus acus TaxID=161584 RepID=UPI00188626F6|nr:titin isoform X16 [Syngnathus acus]